MQRTGTRNNRPVMERNHRTGLLTPIKVARVLDRNRTLKGSNQRTPASRAARTLSLLRERALNRKTAAVRASSRNLTVSNLRARVSSPVTRKLARKILRLLKVLIHLEANPTRIQARSRRVTPNRLSNLRIVRPAIPVGSQADLVNLANPGIQILSRVSQHRSLAHSLQATLPVNRMETSNRSPPIQTKWVNQPIQIAVVPARIRPSLVASGERVRKIRTTQAPMVRRRLTSLIWTTRRK